MMDTNLTIISYTFAAIAGICFASGVAVLSRGRGNPHGSA